MILENIMEYEYQGLDPATKLHHLFKGIMCDKLSTAVAIVKAHPDRYEKDFDTLVTYLSQYVEKLRPIMSVNVVSVTQSRPAKRQKTSEAHGTL